MNSTVSTNLKVEVTQRQVAIVAGTSLLIMAVSAAFSFGFVYNNLIITGDAAVTTQNIMNSGMLFRSSLLGWLIILVCDVLVAWALYLFLIKVNRRLSLLTAWFRLIYSAILGFAIGNLVIVVLLTSETDFSTSFQTEEIQTYVMLFLNVFENIWALGLIVFGLHLLLLGYLVYYSGYIPKILGVLLVIAAISYLFIDISKLILPQYEDFIRTMEIPLSLPMAIGELAFSFWLLIKGGKVPVSKKQP